METARFNELLKRYNTDKLAFEEIYKEFFPLAVFHLIKRFKNTHLAKDIAQDFFFHTLPHVKITEDIRYPRGWICLACSRLAINALSSEVAATTLRSAEDLEFVEPAIDENVLLTRNDAESDEAYFDTLLLAGVSEKVVDAFRKLNDRKTAELFILHYYEGYSQKEIADLVKISYENVRVKMHRGKKFLRSLLKCVTFLFFLLSI